MPRLGGGSQQLYLPNTASSGSQTVTTIMSSPTSHSESFSGVYVHQQETGNSSSSPLTGKSNANNVSAYRGSGSILPKYSNLTDSRSPTFSSRTLLRVQTDSSSHSEGSLRRRSRFDSNGTFECPILTRNSSSPGSYAIQSPSRRSSQPWRLSHLIQGVVLFAIFSLVWNSHRKLKVATEQLLWLQNEERLLISQMSLVEGRANELRAKIKSMKEEEKDEADSIEPAFQRMKLQQYLAHFDTEDKKLTEQLKILQKRIQKSARESIVKMYGEGVIHVDLELKFDDGEGIITLELSEETPHAVWVWLQQISQHDWDDSMFRWKLDHVIVATSARMTSQSYNLEFIEENPLNHEVHSVGLNRSEGGGVNFYINLQDNGPYHEDDVCIGKVVGGFDNLKRLLGVPTHEETNHLDPAVSIRTVTITKKKEKQIK